MKYALYITLFVTLLFATVRVEAQQAHPFDQEVADIVAKDGTINKKKSSYLPVAPAYVSGRMCKATFQTKMC